MRQIDIVKLYKHKRCLVIDDMPDIRVSLVAMLRAFGVQEIDVAPNGELAIEACASTKYQLVVCDYNLGIGRDGQQVLEELRYRNRLNNTSIFVMITAESSREMVLGALEYQPDDYITKPITQTLLRQRLDRVLLRNRELYGIKMALDEKDYATAEMRCADRLAKNTSYRSACLQIQAEMNLRLLNFKRAEEIYNEVLDERPVLWAKLGLGKTYLAQKNYDQAEENLLDVIHTDRRVVEAHDLLADSYLGRGNTLRAQQAMQDASDVSPKSVMRQRRLAMLAKLNEDPDVSLEARRRVIKIARNSCYESAEDYFNLARELTDLSEENGDFNDKYAKETFEVLQRLEKKPYFDVSAHVQTDAIKSRSLLVQKRVNEAQGYLQRARALYEERRDELNPEVGLDFAKTLIASGDKAAADAVLTQLIEQFPDNQTIVSRADAMSDTPKSKEGRKKVADMTKQGIQSYEQGKYPEAITVFKEAIGIFPAHVGLNLNLIQAVIAESKLNGVQFRFERMTRKALERVSVIGAGDPQYARYQYLKKQIEDLFHFDMEQDTVDKFDIQL